MLNIKLDIMKHYSFISQHKALNHFFFLIFYTTLVFFISLAFFLLLIFVTCVHKHMKEEQWIDLPYYNCSNIYIIKNKLMNWPELFKVDKVRLERWRKTQRSSLISLSHCLSFAAHASSLSIAHTTWFINIFGHSLYSFPKNESCF